jgi:hypothetical protein
MAKKAKKAAKQVVAPRIAAVGRDLAPRHPEKRYPVSGDDTHEILCRWTDGQTQCKQVPTGGNWDD